MEAMSSVKHDFLMYPDGPSLPCYCKNDLFLVTVLIFMPIEYRNLLTFRNKCENQRFFCSSLEEYSNIPDEKQEAMTMIMKD